MITKLNLHLDDPGLDIRYLIEDKINELIEAFNALHGDYDLHYHETLNNKTYPKVKE